MKTELSPKDRRTILVSLTPRGARMKGRVTEHMRACENRICGKLEKTNVGAVKEALERLEAAL